MDMYTDKFSPDAWETLHRCVSYGWRPSVAAKILNCQYGFSLTARDVSDILSALEESNAVASKPEQNADQAD